jgi:hypothetical protein
MRAVADEEVAVYLYTSLSQRGNFFEEGHWVKHDAIADHAAAAGTKHATRYELKNEFLAIDDYRMAGIVSASIARNYRKVFGENVDNLPFAFIAPLGANYNRGFALAQITLHWQQNRTATSRIAGRTHSALNHKIKR